MARQCLSTRPSSDRRRSPVWPFRSSNRAVWGLGAASQSFWKSCFLVRMRPSNLKLASQTPVATVKWKKNIIIGTPANVSWTYMSFKSDGAQYVSSVDDPTVDVKIFCIKRNFHVFNRHVVLSAYTNWRKIYKKKATAYFTVCLHTAQLRRWVWFSQSATHFLWKEWPHGRASASLIMGSWHLWIMWECGCVESGHT